MTSERFDVGAAGCRRANHSDLPLRLQLLGHRRRQIERDLDHHLHGDGNPIAASSVLVNAYISEADRRTRWDFEDESPGKDAMNEVKVRTQAALKQTESDDELMAIWYRDAYGVLHDFMDQDVPKFNMDPGANPVSITSETS